MIFTSSSEIIMSDFKFAINLAETKNLLFQKTFYSFFEVGSSSIECLSIQNPKKENQLTTGM